MKNPVPVNGTVEVVTQFLWFPKTIDNECRWLETATWKRKFVIAEGEAFWKNLEWIDNAVTVPEK